VERVPHVGDVIELGGERYGVHPADKEGTLILLSHEAEVEEPRKRPVQPSLPPDVNVYAREERLNLAVEKACEECGELFRAETARERFCPRHRAGAARTARWRGRAA
jgi:hypothetical protein